MTFLCRFRVLIVESTLVVWSHALQDLKGLQRNVLVT
jgi:hypothetical protein